MEKRFGISDAARQVGVEAHVLREADRGEIICPSLLGG